MKKKIAVDMDGVLADTPMQAIKWVKREFGLEMNLKEAEGTYLYYKLPKELQPTAIKFLDHPDYFRDIPVMENAIEVMRELHEKYELFITTAATQFRHSFAPKYDWLEEHLPFIDWQHMVFCGSKSIINADIMIDDHTFNLDNFEGEGLLFTQYHNVNKTGYKRVNNWLEVQDYLL